MEGRRALHRVGVVSLSSAKLGQYRKYTHTHAHTHGGDES